MWDWIGKLAEFREKREPVVLVSVTKVKGSSPRETGAKMIVQTSGNFFGTIGGGHLEKQVLEEVQKCFQENKTRTVEYPLCSKTGQCCGGVVEVMLEVLNHNPSVYIFGVGHVGQALCRTLLGTPFNVHAIDDREEWIHSENLPNDVTQHAVTWRTFVEKADWDKEKTYAVIMTCSHDVDRDIIAEVTKKPAKYIGLIGSRNKWLDFQLKLSKAGVDKDQLRRVHCPIGEKLVGKSPQEVAISVAFELLKIYYGE